MKNKTEYFTEPAQNNQGDKFDDFPNMIKELSARLTKLENANNALRKSQEKKTDIWVFSISVILIIVIVLLISLHEIILK